MKANEVRATKGTEEQAKRGIKDDKRRLRGRPRLLPRKKGSERATALLIYFLDYQHDIIERISRETGMSKTALVRLALDRTFRKEKRGGVAERIGGKWYRLRGGSDGTASGESC